MKLVSPILSHFKSSIHSSPISSVFYTMVGNWPDLNFLHKNIQNSLLFVGHLVSRRDSRKSDQESVQSKRKRSSQCETSKNRKTSNKCCKCSAFVCNEHCVKQIFVWNVLNTKPAYCQYFSIKFDITVASFCQDSDLKLERTVL